MRLYVILEVGLRNREVRFTPGNRYIRGMGELDTQTRN
jgi:hypothetical protein